MSPEALFERVFSLSKKFAAALVQEAAERVTALSSWRVHYHAFSARALSRVQIPEAKLGTVYQF